MNFSYLTKTSKFVVGFIIASFLALTIGTLIEGISGSSLLFNFDRSDTIEWVRIALVIVFLFVMFLSMLLTKHQVTEESLVIRQGILITARIPIRNIASIAPTDKMPFGLGVRFAPDRTIYINMALKGLVAVNLKEPMRFWMFGIIPLWKMKRVVINLADPTGFVGEIQSRLNK